MPSNETRPAGEAWPLWQRISFRYLALHWLLFAFPMPLDDLSRTAAAIWRRLLGAGESLPNWALTTFREVDGTLATPEAWWQSLSHWLFANDLTFGIHVMPGSWSYGDSGHGYVRLVCITVFATTLTALWTMLDRRKSGHPRLARWLHLGARWHLSLALLGYGCAKFCSGQFQAPDAFTMTDEIGNQTPSAVVWNFMGASQPYQYLSGLGELAGFVLLLHRRTALMGCFVSAAVMSNVCALNWCYGIPLKLLSTYLLLIAVLLMAPFRHRLWALFISNATSPPVDLRVVQTRWLGRPLMVLGWAWAIAAAVNTSLNHYDTYQRRLLSELHEPVLHGVWRVEHMLLDGTALLTTDPSRWQHIAINRGDRARIKTLAGQVSTFAYSENLAAGEISMTPTDKPDDAMVWQFETSKVTRKAGNPEPKTRAEMSQAIDVECDALLIHGDWHGQKLEVHTTLRTMPMNAAFRWIYQYPK